MEDSFNARVGKIFGSLNSSSSSSPSSSSAAMSSLWSLTDDEVERKHWNRREVPDRNEQVEVGVEEADEDEDEESHSTKPDDYNEEEWELKSSIGLDCTLDFEEEEDEYDKVAVEDEDGVYMKEVADESFDIDSRKQLVEASVIQDAEQGPLNPKSILKRKGNQPLESDSKPSKRVRFFDPSSVHHCNDEDEPTPDYLLNPSRYTHYTFDSSSLLDDDSNRQAYMDFLREKAAEVDVLSGPVTFIPRKKAGDTTAMVDSCTELVQQVGIGNLVLPSALTAADETSVCAMEEDDQPPSHTTKPIRKYRLKPPSESQD